MLKRIKVIEVYSDIAGHRKGASYGIEALRTSSIEENSQYYEKLDVDTIGENNQHYPDSIFKHAKHADRIHTTILNLASKVKEARDERKFPIVIAGDHSSCAGTMHGLKMAHPDAEIGVIYIDAHADIHSPYTSSSGNMHGMPLAMACALDNLECQINELTLPETEYWNKLKFMASNEASIKPENIVFCAVRDYQEEEMSLIKKHKIPLYSVEEITHKGIGPTVEEIFKKLEYCDHIYVSFDVDSVDPLYIPGTGTPAENGLSYEQAMQLNIELIKNEKVCCWEMAEINPLYNNSKDDSTRIFKILEKVTHSLLNNY
ncbi:arginase [Poseidonibacter parvus]|uniref:Arginase n=1 Tax=Poseidonibacter parvus TaxID=1850254 RepID=A0A1P8KJR4_9BACT|nr:arginase [Poseidonibacter parvus]APW64746.1 arginase [Poseidonibacter parvus]